MTTYIDYRQQATYGERLFGTPQKAPYYRQHTDDTLVDGYYDVPISLDGEYSSYASSSSFSFQHSHSLTPASSIESSHHPSEYKDEETPSMSEAHRYLRGNYSHVSPLNISSSPSASRTALNEKALPATAAEEEDMLITPIDQGVVDRDFATRGRGMTSNTLPPQPLYRTHQAHPSISTTLESPNQLIETPVEDYATFHDRVSANFDPIRDSASPRHSVLSSRTGGNKRWSILSMQQAMMEPPMPVRPAKWFERETNATFTLKLAPRGMTTAKPKSASSGAFAAPTNIRDDDWELPILADDPLALSRLLVSALFTMQDVPGSMDGPKQHALQLVPARSSGAKHFAMKQVKGDPLAGGKTGEEGKEGAEVVKAPEAKKVMWKISFKAVSK